MKYFVIFFILIGVSGFGFALGEEVSHSMMSGEEHYEIEIIGLKDKYSVGEEYSFSFVISGYGHPCANHQTSYPDENGNTMHMGAEVLCAPEKSMHEFKFNPLDGKEALGNTGIKKPGTYTVTVTFEKPNKYYPTTISKEFQVVESIAENINKLSPLKQFKMGIKFLEIQCKDGLELVAKMPSAHPKCVKPESVEKLTMRGWATTNKTIELTNPTKYIIDKNDIPFEVQYSLKGATLDGIAHDVDANSICVALDNSVGGHMVISIPRELIDAKIGKGDIDDLFFLLIDGEENMYGEKTNETERTITIWFPKDASEIEIIGVSWT